MTKYIIIFAISILGILYSEFTMYGLESSIRDKDKIINAQSNTIAELRVTVDNLRQDSIIREELEERIKYDSILKDINLSNGSTVYF